MEFKIRSYSISDFLEWDERGQLILEPKFQRRSVWSEKGKSFLMDSIISGKPLPKFYIRQYKDPETNELMREVVDGQQRLRAILGYIDNGFKISKIHNKEYGGMFFRDLPPDVQASIETYELAVDLLIGAADSEVLDIFARLNSYSVTLNHQEERHAKYAGVFKHLAHSLSNEYHNFWLENRILTEKQIARMEEAELTSDLLIAMIEGIKAKTKKIIDNYYKVYEDKLPNVNKYSNNFRHTMDVIGEMSAGIIPTTRFARGLMFYSLFCSTYHMLYGLPFMNIKRIPIKKPMYPRVRTALEKIDEIFVKDEDKLSKMEKKFYEAASRATTDAPNRRYRSKYICHVIANVIS